MRPSTSVRPVGVSMDGHIDAQYETVVIRAQIECDAEDESYAKALLRQAIRNIDPTMSLRTTFVADPLVNHEARDRQLFCRVTLRPTDIVRASPAKPLIGRLHSTIVTVALWAAILGSLCRAGYCIDRISFAARRRLSVVGAGLLFGSSVVFIPALQPSLLLRHVLMTFDFWYVVLLIGGACFVEASGAEDLHATLAENIAVHVALGVALIAGFAVAEGYATSQLTKAARYTVLSALCFLESLAWSMLHPHADQTLQLGVFATTFAAAAQSLYASLGVYMLRATFTTLTGRRTPPFLSIPCAVPVT